VSPGLDPAGAPDWLAPLVAATSGVAAERLSRRATPPADAREAAVLMLFGEDGAGPGSGPDVLLLRRADTLGSHAGQVAFPGGGTEPGDDGPVGTALREAEEEVGVRPEGVRPLALLPRLHVPVSGFAVTPVLAHWAAPAPVHAVDAGETAAVARVPLAHLTDPAHRIQVRHPSGFVAPGFLVPGMLIWGFTAGLLTGLLTMGGWDRPWRTDDVRDLDAAWRDALAMTAVPGHGGDVVAEVEESG
jgi:8-oxo-dGTP pyrophosphatase MutT (NUDIX family)